MIDTKLTARGTLLEPKDVSDAMAVVIDLYGSRVSTCWYCSADEAEAFAAELLKAAAGAREKIAERERDREGRPIDAEYAP